MARVTLLPVAAGAAILLGAGFATTVVLPTSDTANTRHTESTRAYGKDAAAGIEIYVNQGCVTCHTQQVRDAFSDAGLAQRPTRAGDTLSDRPGQLGTVRFGPDLTCVGDRVPGAAADAADDAGRVDAMVAYLRDPASVHPGSTMPSYSYLDSGELRQLAAYLVTLHCELTGTSDTGGGVMSELPLFIDPVDEATVEAVGEGRVPRWFTAVAVLILATVLVYLVAFLDGPRLSSNHVFVPGQEAWQEHAGKPAAHTP